MTQRILALFAALLCAGAASADTLDLSSLPAGNLGASASVPGATMEGIGNSTISNQSNRYFQNAGGSICAQKGSGANCEGKMNITFDGPVKKLNFYSAGYQPGDSMSIVLYHNHQVVGTSGFSWNGRVDLTAWKNVTRIKIEYQGLSGGGMAIGKFNYTPKGANRDKGKDSVVNPDLVTASVTGSHDGAKGKGNNGGGRNGGKDSGHGKDGTKTR